MEIFFNEILEDEELKTKLKRDVKLCEKAKKIALEIIKGKMTEHIEHGILPIAILGNLTKYALETNSKRNIPREITIETLKDINAWIKTYEKRTGKKGLQSINWLLHHYKGDLFSLGRLQFRLEKSFPEVPSGEYSVQTHIPQDVPLVLEECLESFVRADRFFNQYFRQYDFKYITCRSWLVNPKLSYLLDENSNIVKFMKLWTPCGEFDDNSKLAIERVFGFGFDPTKISDAPENTTLQRNLKAYLLAGNSLKSTYGYRKL